MLDIGPLVVCSPTVVNNVETVGGSTTSSGLKRRITVIFKGWLALILITLVLKPFNSRRLYVSAVYGAIRLPLLQKSEASRLPRSLAHSSSSSSIIISSSF